MGNSINQIANTVTLLKRGIHDCENLQKAYNRGGLKLKVYKEYKGPVPEIMVRATCAFLMQTSGCADMSGFYSNAVYRVKKRLVKGDEKTPIRVYVTVQSRSNDAIVVGIFDHMMTADAWISENYGLPGTPVKEIRFCKNLMTKRYRRKYGYKFVNTL